MWRKSDRATRRKLFEPVKIRQELDKRDGNTEMKRAAEYSKLSELASHATYRGFALTTRGSFAEFGPFVEAINLRAFPEKTKIGGIPLRRRIGFNNHTGEEAGMGWGSRIRRICEHA